MIQVRFNHPDYCFVPFSFQYLTIVSIVIYNITASFYVHANISFSCVCMCGRIQYYYKYRACLEVFVEGQHLLGRFHAHTRLRVFGNSLFEEIRLSLQRNLR